MTYPNKSCKKSDCVLRFLASGGVSRLLWIPHAQKVTMCYVSFLLSSGESWLTWVSNAKKKLTVCLRFLASRGVTWLHSLPPDVCHDVFTCVTWLIHMHDMTRSCVWHDSLICHARYFDSFALRVVLISTLTHTRTHILCRALSLPFSLSKSLSLSLSLSTSLSPSFFLSPSLSFSLPLSFLQTHLSSHLILTWPLHFFHLFSFFFVHSSSVFFKRSQDQVYFPPCILGVCVCVCVRTHTHTTHTHQPPVKNGETLPSSNESLTLETNANRRPAGKPPLTPLLHTHAIVFKTPVNSAENTCRAYIRKEKMTTTKWIKMMTETTSKTTMARSKLMQT